MIYTEALTRYTANFIDELTANGLRDVVISPGSRSTPLAVLCAEHEKVKDWIVVDERSAAYFALGIAQASQRPVALVCTSGTAAANYFPAVVEAYYARVPLIVLTADRPHELRDIGSPQTINQVGMYHDFVKLFYEMAPPKATDTMLAYVRNRAFRTIKAAVGDNPGPVHVNFPFQEPLMPDVSLPDLWKGAKGNHVPQLFSGKKRLSEEELTKLSKFLMDSPKGLLVCGQQVDRELGAAITALSEQLSLPILADPLSQLRRGNFVNDHMITTYDTLFRSEKIRTNYKPDYIIRFGAMPISKHYLFFLQAHPDVPQFVVENSEAVREPTNHESHYLIADATELCEDLLLATDDRIKREKTWLHNWQNLSKMAQEELQAASSEKLTEGTAVRQVIEQLTKKSHLFVANSMPIRDVDTFLFASKKQINIYANRGVSGIDGTMSSALGVAASGQHVTLIIGDLSFYHDLNSLLIAKRYQLPITIILINNNGGGIFSFLPQAKEEKYFEHLFGTPLDIDFKHAVDLYEGSYKLVKNEAELAAVLKKSKTLDQFSVIELQTDRVENVTWHRDLWAKIVKRLEKDDTL